MNPWAMLGLLIVCVVAVTLWLRVWADIVSLGPERDTLSGSFPRHDVIWSDVLGTFVMFGSSDPRKSPEWWVYDGEEWKRDGP